MYIDLLKLKSYKVFENSHADLSWLLFERSQLVLLVLGVQEFTHPRSATSRNLQSDLGSARMIVTVVKPSQAYTIVSKPWCGKRGLIASL